MATVLVIGLLAVIAAALLLGGPAVLAGIGVLLAAAGQAILLFAVIAGVIGGAVWFGWTLQDLLGGFLLVMTAALALKAAHWLLHGGQPVEAPPPPETDAERRQRAGRHLPPVDPMRRSMLSELSGLRRHAATLGHEISGAAAAQKADAEKRIAELERLLKIAPAAAEDHRPHT